MTNFLNWPKTTWALVLWSGYIATWTLVTGPGPAMVALWWVAGMILLGSLLFATQPLFQQGRRPQRLVRLAPRDGVAQRHLRQTTPPRDAG